MRTTNVPLPALVALVALLAGGPALAAPKVPAAPKPPSTAAPDAPAPLTEQRRAQLFAPYDEAMQRGQKTQAADALLPILDDPTVAGSHGEAWVKLGDLLKGFDMAYSALIAYGNAIAVDPDVGATKVKDALDLAERLGDERLLGPILAKNVGLKVDEQVRSRIALVAARQYVQNGDYGVALGMLMLVKRDDPRFGEAELLRGVVLAQQGRFNDALAPLLTAQALGEKAGKGERFRNVLTLNVARSYFGAGNYPRAVEYYAKVERGSDFWVDAWFEKAWAHFRADDMNGALASLMVHESPFYEQWYWPEADLLRSYAYFSMCKFKDATVEVDTFEQRYQPVYAQLNAALQGYTAQDGWTDALAAIDGQTTRLPRGVLRDFTKDERLLGVRESVAKADDELSRLRNVSANVFAQRASQTLTERRATLIAEEGGRVIAKAYRAQGELKEMLGNIKITRLDMMQYETEQLERASQTGQIETGDRIGRLRKLRKRPDMRVWPWQGEYWADEVGYYQVLARPDCPDSLRPKTDGS
jgi:tetratricopeptide (TPR) repeat protein